MNRRRRMGAISIGDPRLVNLIQTSSPKVHGVVVEEIEGLIRVYKDGYVERLPVVGEVPCTWSPEGDVTSRDMVIDQSTRVWARIYVPTRQGFKKLPLLVYFHGGGFCVGSAAWRVYHEFLARLVSRAGCIVVSVNYHLAPENRLPAAYEDGLNAVKWVRQQSRESSSAWWAHYCDFSRVFLGGDSAGASIAHNVATRLGSPSSTSSSSSSVVVSVRGVILIQPFFGAEARTPSERNMAQPAWSPLSLAASDSYWRLALPAGASRDHQWCNPLGRGSSRSKLEEVVRLLPPVLVFISDMDILRDRELEFCKAMKRAGKVDVEHVIHTGVGHAFQVLGNSRTCQARTQEMLAQIKAFLNNNI